VSALVASVVAANPRGAPITLPADDNPTPIVEDAINAPPPEPEYVVVQGPDHATAGGYCGGPVCALDHAPKNSVLTMLQWPGESTKPVLMTPQGEQVVASNDYAQTLPRMAEIRRVGEVAFVARQLDDPIGHPDLVCTSAVECIRQFKKHFHGERE
jgi:hypothetical protein